MERLVISAIWVDDGKKYVHQPRNVESGFVVLGYRHCNCIETLAIMGLSRQKISNGVQGFLSDKNVFYNREDSLLIAEASNQLLNETLLGSFLTSEDLWLSNV